MPLLIPDVSLPQAALETRRTEIHYRRRMLDKAEGSTPSSENEPENTVVHGQVPYPSEESKEDKVEVSCKGKVKTPNGTSPEKVKEPPKPRASVLEYKSVSQVYVFRMLNLTRRSRSSA